MKKLPGIKLEKNFKKFKKCFIKLKKTVNFKNLIKNALKFKLKKVVKIKNLKISNLSSLKTQKKTFEI